MLRNSLFAIALFAASAAGAATLDQVFDRTYNVGPGTRVVVENVNGRVTVTSWDQPRVRVRGEEHVEARDDAAARKMMASLINVTAQNGVLRIHTNHPENKDGFLDWLAGTRIEAHVRYEITVPRAVNLDVSTTNGALAATAVNGVLRFETTNGRIVLERCSGELDASTTNGSITADLLGVAPGRPLRLETTNGRIGVTLPRNVAARIDAETSNGAIKSDLPVTTFGSIERHSLRGTINGGGNAELRLRTTNGGIEIKGR